MAYYNNGFPATYQPYYQQAYQPPVVPAQNNNAQSQNSGIIWVQGEAGAKSYLVAPNTTVQLWDSENQVIYLKSADASGMPNIKTLDYTIRDAQSASEPIKADDSKFISKDELNGLKSDVEALRHDVDKIKHARVKLTKIDQEEDDYE